MKKVIQHFFLIPLLLISLTITFSGDTASASETTPNSTTQQDTIFVTYQGSFFQKPPANYYYDNGTYRGYIPRLFYTYNSQTKRYIATYGGYVGRNAAIPSRAAVTEE